MRLAAFIIVLLFQLKISLGQTTYVPDDQFEQALIDLGYDTVLDDYVFTSSINTITVLNVENEGIFDLTGIEDFTSLKKLYCRHNYLSQLELNFNSQLTYLECQGNNLDSLDFSQNLYLDTLVCNNNELVYLNLQNNTDLFYLNCSWNSFDTLDLQYNPTLISLSCNQNQIQYLNISMCPDLKFLDCSSNNLTSLTVSNNTYLEILRISNNDISTLNISANDSLIHFYAHNTLISNVDLSDKPFIYKIDCSYMSNLVELSISNGNNNNLTYFLAFGNPYLFCIEVDDKSFMDSNFDSFKDAQCLFLEDCDLLQSKEHPEIVRSVFPNPTTQLLSVNSNIVSSYEIVDLAGQVVKNGSLFVGNQNLDLSDIKPGMYVLIVNSNSHVEKYPILKL